MPEPGRRKSGATSRAGRSARPESFLSANSPQLGLVAIGASHTSMRRMMPSSPGAVEAGSCRGAGRDLDRGSEVDGVHVLGGGHHFEGGGGRYPGQRDEHTTRGEEMTHRVDDLYARNISQRTW